MNTMLSDRNFDNAAWHAQAGKKLPLGSDRKAIPTLHSVLVENDMRVSNAESNDGRYHSQNSMMEQHGREGTRYIDIMSARQGSASRAYANQGRSVDIVYNFKGDSSD